MNTEYFSLKLNSVLLCLMFLFSGCISSPVQKYAKTGQIITAQIGSVKQQANYAFIAPADLSVTIKDSAGATFPVKVLGTFRVFSDPAGMLDGQAMAGESYFGGYDGQWVAQLQLVNPTTESPLALAPGTATLSVSSPKLQPFSYIYNQQEPYDNLKIEIIPGQDDGRLPGNLEVQAVYVEPAVYLLEIKPAQWSGLDSLGGAQITYKYVTADFGGIKPRIIKTIPDPFIQLITSETVDGIYTVVKTVMLNPKGFYPRNGYAGVTTGSKLHPGYANLGASQWSDIILNIAWNGMSNSAGVWSDHVIFVPEQSYYFDLNGQKLSIQPTISRIN